MSKVGKNGMSHDRAVLLLNQSLRACTVEDVVDALVELKSLEDVFAILDLTLEWHQRRLERSAVPDPEEGEDAP